MNRQIEDAFCSICWLWADHYEDEHVIQALKPWRPREVESNKEGAKACDYCNTPNCELPCHNTSNKEGVEVNE